MVEVPSVDFDLRKIMESGQCFRMLPQDGGWILVVSEDKHVRARLRKNGIWELDCTKAAFEGYWRRYFDLGRDYAPWLAQIDPDDAYLLRAAEIGRGLRVVNQDPWEALVGFIVSQRKSVGAITGCLDKLSRKYGREVRDKRGCAHLFPSAQVLAALSPDDLADCSLGYRAPYVIDAARKVASGEIDLHALEQETDTVLIEKLMTIRGVGIKVACCVALYGFRRLGLFPVDVWIGRILEEHYPQGFPLERYRDFAGYLQLLMFYEARHRKPARPDGPQAA